MSCCPLTNKGRTPYHPHAGGQGGTGAGSFYLNLTKQRSIF